MPIFLEVIVTSAAEARAAEQGGADRLELVRDLDSGGLTPPLQLVEEVLSTVAIPVRVMLREANTMSIAGPSDIPRLQHSIHRLAALPINGLVLGFLQNSQIDTPTLSHLLPQDVACSVTFHRAFDEAADPLAAIAVLKQYPSIDRILTRAAENAPWPTRRSKLEEFQAAASPAIQMLFAVGLDTSRLAELQQSPTRYEVHVGRAARVGHLNSGAVSPELVAALKHRPSMLSAPPATPGTAPKDPSR